MAQKCGEVFQKVIPCLDFATSKPRNDAACNSIKAAEYQSTG